MKFYFCKGLRSNTGGFLWAKLLWGLTAVTEAWTDISLPASIVIYDNFLQNHPVFQGIFQSLLLQKDSRNLAFFAPHMNETYDEFQGWNCYTSFKCSEGVLQLIYLVESGVKDKLTSILILADEILRQSRTEFNLWLPRFLILFPESLEEGSLIGNISEIMKERNIRIPLDAHVYFISCLLENDEDFQCFSAFEAYTIKERRFLKQVELSETAMSLDLTVEFLVRGMVGRRQDFDQTRITGVAVEYLSTAIFEEIIVDGVSELRVTGGVGAEPYLFLRDALNFRDTILRCNKYVVKGPNGTLKGMAVPVNEGLADISVSTNEFLLYRMRGPHGLSYLHVSFRTQMQALFVQPPVDSVRHLHIGVFSWDAWIALSVMWIVLITGASVASAAYRSSFHMNKSSYSVFVWVINCIAMQVFEGGVPANVHLSMQITAVGFLFGLVCFASFSGNLVSLLSQPVIPIKSLQDILRYGFFIYSDTFIPSSGELVQGMERLGMIPKLSEEVRNVNAGIKAPILAKGHSAIISAEDSLVVELINVGWSPDTICSTFSTVEVASEPLNMAMFVKKGSPLKKAFNVPISRMMEGGVGHRILQQYFAKTTLNCLREKERWLSPVGIGDVLSLYIIFCSGIAMALGLLAIEVVSSRQKQFYFMN